ncbi:MAG TPA: hypothetical protein VGD26_11615 [Chitinophagaceae bacterium]
MKDGHKLNKVITPVLALFVVGLSFLLLYLIMFRETTQVEENTIIFVLGALTGWVSIILSYFFGSSQGSKEKTEMLNEKKDEK